MGPLISSRIGSRMTPVDVFEKAVNNVKPVIEVKSRRVGGSTYQVPTEVIPSRRVALGIRWLITHARERSEKTMHEKLAAELMRRTIGAGQSRRERPSTKWPRPTRRLPLIDSNRDSFILRRSEQYAECRRLV